MSIKNMIQHKKNVRVFKKKEDIKKFDLPSN